MTVVALGGAFQPAVPTHFGAVVAVDVDDARRDGEPGNIHAPGRGPGELADLSDPAVFDGDVGDERWLAGAVDDGAAGEREIVVGHAACLRRRRQSFGR